MVELFRRRHGAYPDSLDALVPEFIAEIPRDVFGSTSTDRILMVRREASPAVMRPVGLDEEFSDTAPGLIVYGRGADGTDDGGQIDYGTDIGLRIPFPLSEDKSE